MLCIILLALLSTFTTGCFAINSLKGVSRHPSQGCYVFYSSELTTLALQVSVLVRDTVLVNAKSEVLKMVMALYFMYYYYHQRLLIDRLIDSLIDRLNI